jgi:hypothetical protein
MNFWLYYFFGSAVIDGRRYFSNNESFDYNFQQPEDLEGMMTKVFRLGLEGLVLKDIEVRFTEDFIFINSLLFL